MAKQTTRVALLAIVLWIWTVAPAASQTSPPAGMEVVDVPLAAWLASRDHAAAGTLADFAVGDGRMATFREFVQALVGGDWQKVKKLADKEVLAYQVVAILENNAWFVVASDNSATGKDPTLVINLQPRRDLIVEAPHMPFERGTAEQSAVLLRELGARAAIVSGAHRCASRSFTTCDGKTGVCSESRTLQGYRDSDPAHNVGTLFHAAHVIFANLWSNALVISLHGMLDDTVGVQTSLVISNGIDAEDGQQKTAATKLRLALERPAGAPGKVVSCNMPADAVHQYRALCGTTNVQGRHVNGDADVCRDSVVQGTGRFIHVEQDWSVLRPYAHSWPRILQDPLSKAFIDTLGAVVPVLPAR